MDQSVGPECRTQDDGHGKQGGDNQNLGYLLRNEDQRRNLKGKEEILALSLADSYFLHRKVFSNHPRQPSVISSIC